MSDSSTYRRYMLENNIPEQDLATAQNRWSTEELQRDFSVLGFLAPFVVVMRKTDNVKGSMEFTHSPRYYFNFVPDNR